jgi:hypothetical protein
MDLVARPGSDYGRRLGIKHNQTAPGTQAITAPRISSSLRIHLRLEFCVEERTRAPPRGV